ncbi:Somatostatin receptor type 5 [Mactra antiquata]
MMALVNVTEAPLVNTTKAYVTELVCYLENATGDGNATSQEGGQPTPVLHFIMIASYIFICVCGLVGNGLVIYVVLRFSKMKTVTNVYILNLALSDVLFLLNMPFLITTNILEYWVFGYAMCKTFMLCFSINFITGVFTLTAMSADRYLAVCHPVRSVHYRTIRIAFFICLTIWTLSFLIMLPIMLYSTTVANDKYPDRETCVIDWPDNPPIPGDKAFTWYSFLLGFLIPVALISVFYVSVILRLRSVGPRKKSKERKKSNRKVTRMVLAMIFVYIGCWLPYWCFQVDLTFKIPGMKVPTWKIYMFSAFTVLSFANSMINPVLYAFLSDVFRKSFLKAFNCTRFIESNRSHTADNSVFPRSTTRKDNGKSERYEFTSMVNQTENTCMHTNSAFQLNNMDTHKTEMNGNEEPMLETNIQYVDKEIQTKHGQEE